MFVLFLGELNYLLLPAGIWFDFVRTSFEMRTKSLKSAWGIWWKLVGALLCVTHLSLTLTCTHSPLTFSRCTLTHLPSLHPHSLALTLTCTHTHLHLHSLALTFTCTSTQSHPHSVAFCRILSHSHSLSSSLHFIISCREEVSRFTVAWQRSAVLYIYS